MERQRRTARGGIGFSSTARQRIEERIRKRASDAVAIDQQQLLLKISSQQEEIDQAHKSLAESELRNKLLAKELKINQQLGEIMNINSLFDCIAKIPEEYSLGDYSFHFFCPKNEEFDSQEDLSFFYNSLEKYLEGDGSDKIIFHENLIEGDIVEDENHFYFPLIFQGFKVGYLKITKNKRNNLLINNVHLNVSDIGSTLIKSIENFLKKEQHYYNQANTDYLTQLPNRKSFFGSLKKYINNANKGKRYVAFFMIDIDFFKNLNDTCGHLTGDRVLQEMAQLLQGAMNKVGDVVGRIGGEEFGVVIQHNQPGQERIVAERIQELVKNLNFNITNKFGLKLTLSIGVYSAIPYDSMNDEMYYSRADEALYRAKGNGRNQIVYY